MKSEFEMARELLYKSMQLPRDGKIKAFAEEQGVSTQWVRHVLDGTHEDVVMLEKCIEFLEKWNEKKRKEAEGRRQHFVHRASKSPALVAA